MTSLSDGLVKLEQIVRPLEWVGDDAQSPFGLYTVRRTPDGYAAAFQYDEIAHVGFNAVDPLPGPRMAAIEHANTDYRVRLASALNLDLILSEIKRMMEVVEAASAFMPLAQVAFLWQTKGAQGDEVERYRDGYWRLKAALSTLSPQEPDNG